MAGLHKGLQGGLTSGLFGGNAISNGLCSGLFGNSRSQIALLKGLVSYWMLEADGTDVFGFNTLTASNMSFATGKIGNGAVFNGSTSSLIKTNPVLVKNNTYTVSMWAKLSSGTSGTLWEIGDTVIADQFGDFSSSKVRFGTYCTNTVADITPNTPNPVTLGAWNHFVFVRDAMRSYKAIYQNGALANGAYSTLRYGPGTSYGANTQRFCLGVRGTSVFLNGAIDEVGYWRRALSPNEVAALYKNTFGSQYPFNL